jgi:hypothetical protein
LGESFESLAIGTELISFPHTEYELFFLAASGQGRDDETRAIGSSTVGGVGKDHALKLTRYMIMVNMPFGLYLL